MMPTMTTTTSIGSYLASQSQSSQTSQAKTTSAVQAGSSASAAASTASSGTSATISTLARQLAASATRVDALARTLNRSQLAARANAILGALTAKADAAQQAKYDKETPRTGDPALLARAKQATAFMVSTRSGATSSVANPFAGLSREQLYYVVYDDSGSYTFNERAAALNEVSRQEAQWRDKVSADGKAEYNQSGKLTKFFTALLDHYKGLPAIAQAQYPDGYARNLQIKIAQNLNYRSGTNAKSFDAVVSDLMGNGKSTTAATSGRQSAATEQLAALRVLQQAKGGNSASNSTTGLLQSRSQASAGASANMKTVDSLLNGGTTAAKRSTLFDFFGS